MSHPSEPHRIRLRQPWQLRPLASGGWQARRHFNRPTGLESAGRVELVVETSSPLAQLQLNGVALQVSRRGESEFRCEVTSRLQSRNEIHLLFASPAPGASKEAAPEEIPLRGRGDLPFQVRLEIFPR
jgi:beta-galactosidase/beta-glucuronidase